MQTWKTPFQPPMKALFFGEVNASVTIPQCAENRKACMTLMDGAPLATPYQWHSADCHVLTEKPSKPLEGDAYVTAMPGLAIGILTADCAPILFAGQMQSGAWVVGAAHAGARGALKGIIAATVKAMRGLGVRYIEAVIGPCIRQKSYEVGPEFYDEFTERASDIKPFFEKNGSWHFDLPGYCRHLLTEENVAVTDVGIDTYTNAHCFSYRRATHKGEADYGRQLSAIMISSARP